MTKLFLIRGVSGSGKSSLSRELLLNGVVDTIVEADDFFYNNNNYEFDVSKLGLAHNQCKERVISSLMEGKSVAVSNTSTREQDVKTYQNIAKKCSAKFISIIVENRNDTSSIHDVPEEVLTRQAIQLYNSIKLK